MAQNGNNMGQVGPSNDPSSPTNSMGTGGSGHNMLLILIAAVLIAIVVVAIIALYFTGGSSSVPPVTTIGHSTNSTASYLSIADSQALLGSSVSQYAKYDLFNLTNPLNISDIAQIDQGLPGNSTSGWATLAGVQNSTANSSIEFYVFQVNNNAPGQYSTLASDADYQFYNGTSPSTTTGTINGMTYTLASFSNSTSSRYVITGWKNNDVVLVLVDNQGSFAVNNAKLLNITAAETP